MIFMALCNTKICIIVECLLYISTVCMYLMYVLYVCKQYFGDCLSTGCMYPLAVNLAIIFGVRYATTTVVIQSLFMYCIHIHTYIHTYIDSYIHTLLSDLYLLKYTFIHTYIHSFTHTYIHMHTHTYTCIHIHTYIIYLPINI